MINLTPDDISLIGRDGSIYPLHKSGYIAWIDKTQHESDADDNRQVPVYEDTPREIVMTTPTETRAPLGLHAFEDDGLLLVSQAVAHAAAMLKHPLAGRMVWAVRPSKVEAAKFPENGYKGLQRLPPSLVRRRGMSH
jgi:hypothetical protein